MLPTTAGRRPLLVAELEPRDVQASLPELQPQVAAEVGFKLGERGWNRHRWFPCCWGPGKAGIGGL